MRTVVLLVSLAVDALQASLDLRTTTDSVANLHGLDILADLDSSANDLVANAKRHGSLTPTTCTCVNMLLLLNSQFIVTNR